MMAAYYNDNDAYCAEWLRNLIKAGHIPPGDVDERSITDVKADDLKGYIQHHFFAGIAGWPEALRLAGYSADRSIWTASCPCPPFSSAGKHQECPECKNKHLVWCPRRTGFAICAICGHAWFADERHLWPEVWRLAAERRPERIFGEQVASIGGTEWLAGVRGSLEILGYAVGSPDLPACGVGAPTIRQRLFWLADADQGQRGWQPSGEGRERNGTPPGRLEGDGLAQRRGEDGGLGDSDGAGLQRRNGEQANGSSQQRVPIERSGGTGATFWSDYDLIPCTDGKTRRVKSGIQPLAARLPRAMDGLGPISRVGVLKGAGNSICPQVAAEFIRAVMETKLI
ncbi:hypothetical protein LCGC14_2362020 [marine sediment metagenome]|uniref:DNA (cytosine-5-)-methyltransferase n=1 Tax=marine sediment metagenome TaxID=412755 RepID=A0A0F9C6L5_9ZZZZ